MMTKNKTYHRLLSVLLLVCMLVSLAPAAYAEGTEATASEEEATAGLAAVTALTSTTVGKMQIRAYAVGTEAVMSTEGMATCNPSCNAAGISSYTIGEVYGNDVDGYRQDVTFHFASGGCL